MMVYQRFVVLLIRVKIYIKIMDVLHKENVMKSVKLVTT